jgi:hypothetical protein
LSLPSGLTRSIALAGLLSSPSSRLCSLPFNVLPFLLPLPEPCPRPPERTLFLVMNDRVKIFGLRPLCFRLVLVSQRHPAVLSHQNAAIRISTKVCFASQALIFVDLFYWFKKRYQTGISTWWSSNWRSWKACHRRILQISSYRRKSSSVRRSTSTAYQRI